MSQIDKSFLNMAGEFFVAAELNRRKILSSVTYGASKSADIYAFSFNSKKIIKIEVKTTDKKKWPIGTKILDKSTWSKDIFWVFVLLPPFLNNATPNDAVRGRSSPRYFILSSLEVGKLALKSHKRYSSKYQERHGKPYDKVGVPNLTILEVSRHEAKWDKITKKLQKS